MTSVRCAWLPFIICRNWFDTITIWHTSKQPTDLDTDEFIGCWERESICTTVLLVHRSTSINWDDAYYWQIVCLLSDKFSAFRHKWFSIAKMRWTFKKQLKLCNCALKCRCRRKRVQSAHLICSSNGSNISARRRRASFSVWFSSHTHRQQVIDDWTGSESGDNSE